MDSRPLLNSQPVANYETMDSRVLEQNIGDEPVRSGLTEHQFLRLAETIAENLQKIHKNVATMQRMLRKLHRSPHQKTERHQIMTFINKLVSDTSNQLKKMDQCSERHLKMRRDRLVADFTTVLKEFQAVQSKTIEIEKDVMRTARANSSASSSQNELLHQKASYQQQQQLIQEASDLAILEEQERAVHELERNIAGVNEIYEKLHDMVHAQAEVVDNLGTTVENTFANVEEGAEHVHKAAAHQTQMRKKCAIVGLLVTLLLIILILVFTLK